MSLEGLTARTYLDSELALWEVEGALLGLLKGLLGLVLGKTSADGAGLLWSEVEWSVLLVLVEETELGALVGVDDSEDLGDGLANIVAMKRISSASSYRLIRSTNARRNPLQFFLIVTIFSPSIFLPKVEVFQDNTHILVSLAAEPPAIFWVRS